MHFFWFALLPAKLAATCWCTLYQVENLPGRLLRKSHHWPEALKCEIDCAWARLGCNLYLKYLNKAGVPTSLPRNVGLQPHPKLVGYLVHNKKLFFDWIFDHPNEQWNKRFPGMYRCNRSNYVETCFISLQLLHNENVHLFPWLYVTSNLILALKCWCILLMVFFSDCQVNLLLSM